MRKSGAAGWSCAKRRTTSSEYVMPVGFAYFGTHQMPLTEGSPSTRRWTMSMSGPSSSMGMGTFLMPRCAVTLKWRS